jgi:hypothetical protein
MLNRNKIRVGIVGANEPVGDLLDAEAVRVSPRHRCLCYLPSTGELGAPRPNFLPTTAILGVLGILGPVWRALLALAARVRDRAVEAWPQRNPPSICRRGWGTHRGVSQADDQMLTFAPDRTPLNAEVSGGTMWAGQLSIGLSWAPWLSFA